MGYWKYLKRILMQPVKFPDNQVFGKVTPCWPWYLPPRSL